MTKRQVNVSSKNFSSTTLINFLIPFIMSLFGGRYTHEKMKRLKLCIIRLQDWLPLCVIVYAPNYFIWHKINFPDIKEVIISYIVRLYETEHCSWLHNLFLLSCLLRDSHKLKYYLFPTFSFISFRNCNNFSSSSSSPHYIYPHTLILWTLTC